jgi:hypothetical protein
MSLTQVHTYQFTCDNESACDSKLTVISEDTDAAKAHADVDYGWYCGTSVYCHAHRTEQGL